MAKVPTGVRLTDLSTKWGLVTIANKDGVIEREYAITAKEADAVAQGNNVLPPGCTAEEWASGLVMVTTRPCNPGQAVINPDGSLVVNYGVETRAGKVNVSLMKCFPHEFERVGDALHINAAVAAQVDVPFVEIKPEKP